MIDVWRTRRNRDRAAALVEELREAGHNARASNSQRFRADQLDRVERAYHDGANRAIPLAYKDLGVPCELIPGTGGGRIDDMPKPEGYRIEQNGTWWSVVGPDGKVGTSKRSEEEARALLDEVTDADN